MISNMYIDLFINKDFWVSLEKYISSKIKSSINCCQRILSLHKKKKKNVFAKCKLYNSKL